MKRLILLLWCISTAYSQWLPVDSLSTTVRVPAGSSVHCIIDPSAASITPVVSPSAEALTEKAREAIAHAPQWLSLLLEDKFTGLPASDQNLYAQIILDAKDPYVDEIVFTIARLPDEVLTDEGFYTEIIGENARGIYRADSALDYVAIIDSGTAAEGGNYYSTTRYRVEENGEVTEHTLPRDMYYWFVVHPKLQAELPTYIGTTVPEPASPPNGKFWRTYLWDHKEEGYGALCDTMEGITVLWKNRINSPTENGAIGRLSQWCNVIMPWGGHPAYRWPQPVYLYHQHCGTCSEHGWFASAAARTVLIPATLTKAPRNDHKWNEFYAAGWIDWEPINGWINRRDEPSHADDYWSDPSKPPLSGCFNWRGDGFIWNTTERYSEVCTLSVSVTDASGSPVDGARITIDADGVPGNFLVAGWTGSDGFCRFLLGDAIDLFTGAVHSSRGNVTQTAVIRNSRAEEKYEWSPQLSGSVSELPVQSAEPDASTGDNRIKIIYSINARTELVYGKHEYSLFNHSFPCTFTDERTTGSVDYFICNEENFNRCRQGEQFRAAVIGRNTVVLDTFFMTPEESGNWYLVVSGDKKAVVTSVASVSIVLQRYDAAAVRPDSVFFGPKIPSFSVHAHNGFLHATCTLPEKERVSLQLYSAAGKQVAILYKGFIGTGSISRSFPTVGFPAGIYFCRLVSTRFSRAGTIVVIK